MDKSDFYKLMEDFFNSRPPREDIIINQATFDYLKEKILPVLEDIKNENNLDREDYPLGYGQGDPAFSFLPRLERYHVVNRIK